MKAQHQYLLNIYNLLKNHEIDLARQLLYGLLEDGDLDFEKIIIEADISYNRKTFRHAKIRKPNPQRYKPKKIVLKLEQSGENLVVVREDVQSDGNLNCVLTFTPTLNMQEQSQKYGIGRKAITIPLSEMCACEDDEVAVVMLLDHYDGGEVYKVYKSYLKARSVVEKINDALEDEEGYKVLEELDIIQQGKPQQMGGIANAFLKISLFE